MTSTAQTEPHAEPQDEQGIYTCSPEVELSAEGVAKLIELLSRPGRRIPKLAALLRRKGAPFTT